MPARNLPSCLFLLLAFVVATSCQELQVDEVGETYLDLPVTRYQYNNFKDSTNAQPTLGRVLFYDRQLSLNNTVACASCHKQTAGFSDDQKFSRGFEGRFTLRNSMPIQNLVSFTINPLAFESLAASSTSSFGFGSHFFWDGREQELQKLILQPVGNHIEMGITDVDALVKKLSAVPYYTSLFNDAFGSPEITHERISQAVTSFISSINTTNTRFDRFNNSRFMVDQTTGQTVPQTEMNSLELEGMMLFTNKYDCNSCHQVTSPVGYLIAGGTFANIGLDANYADPGLANVTGDASDIGKFKIPSLRNVIYTAPYMHDGRFATLDDVMEHYSEGMANHPNLDPKLKDEGGHARSMNISDHEKKAIVAFLHTLSDESVITDPKFSNPFKVK